MRQGYVPMCIKAPSAGTSGIEAVPFEDATHVLVGSDLAPGSKEEVNVVVQGVTMRGLRLQGIACTYRYAKVDQYIITRQKGMIAILTRHFNGLYDSIFLDTPLDESAIFRDRYPNREMNRPRTRQEIANLVNTKVTAQHHIHYTALEVISAIGESKALKSNAVRLPTDTTMTMCAGVMLWYDQLEPQLQIQIDQSGLFKCVTVAEFKAVAKSISIEAKSLQNIVATDLRSVFEIDTLVNRVDGEVDWQSEMEHRTKPNTTSLSYSQTYTAARRIFLQAASVGRQPIGMEWDKYWGSRWQWSAAGSVHSQHAVDEKYVVRTDRNLKNKFIAISNMPRVPETYFTNRPPQLHAWASVKYEWGQLRAIYGTDITSYIVSNFAFYNCENVLPKRFPVGKDANDANVVNRVTGVLKNRLPYCLDFEDFNSQHSTASMKAVIDAYGDTFAEKFSEGQRRAIEWTSASLDNMIINDNMGLKKTYQSKATLLSGWRLTTFVNSVLNAVYTDEICQGTKEKGSSLHNGDDVLIGTTSLKTAQMSIKRGKELNIRIQPSKCAFGGIAEFLRIDHARGSKGQYLTRAIATLMHSRIESKMSTDARDLVEAMENRFSDCIHRGMSLDMIIKLRHIYYQRQAIVCGMATEDMYIIKMTHRVAGGISEAIDASIALQIRAGATRKGEVEVPNLQGVYDYSLAVAKELEMESKLSYIVDRMYAATYEAVVPKSKAMKVVVNEELQWCYNVKAIYKAFRGTIQTAGFGKAALVGMALDVIQRSEKDTTLKMALARSKDPIKLLRYLI